MQLCVLEEPAAARSGLSPEDRERFDRQLAYFADLKGQGEAYRAQRRLAEARVLVLGCGGLGTWTAIGLLCSGVRRLTLVDPDAVALSNLNRQILFAPGDLGDKKVLAARRALARFDPDATIDVRDERIEGPDRLSALLRDVDFLVATADEPAGQIAGWVNDACLATGTPWISAGQFPPHIRIGPLFVPYETACHACLEHAAGRTHPHYRELTRARAARSVLAATTGPASGMIGSALANDAVAHLSGLHTPATRGNAVLLDLRTLTASVQAVARNPSCAACGDRVGA
jgi:bacteriocin biosynthesis cyclodehydratase domain-containing protein